jgi:hypothetical protein
MQPQILNPEKALRTLQKTPRLLDLALDGIDEQAGRILRDGPDGWSILYIVCHLRDYERIVARRVALILTEDDPVIPAIDNDALAREGDYAGQALTAVREELRADRAALLARLAALDDGQWARVGQHPQQGAGTLLAVAINTGLHDIDHLEQIARCRTGAV